MASIQRADLKDDAAALESYDMALDSDPSLQQAFDRQCALLGDRQDWKGLERAHRKMCYRVRGQGGELEGGLWHRLAVIYRDRLGHRDSAIAAFKQALAIRPDDAATLEALRDLEGPLEYGGDPAYADVDGRWTVEGPNSGGITFYVLWRGHLFRVEEEFSYGTIGTGIPAAQFAATHRGTDHQGFRAIVEALDALGLS